MNLSDFAESVGAEKVTFLIFHQHRQKSQYRSMFSVIDAKRLSSDALKDLVGGGDRMTAKSVLSSTLFYELQL